MAILSVNAIKYHTWRLIQQMKLLLNVSSVMRRFLTALNVRLKMVKWCVLIVLMDITWTLLVNASFHLVELSTLITSVQLVMKETVFNGFCSLINVLLNARLLTTKSVTLLVRATALPLNSPTSQAEHAKTVEWPIVRPVMSKVNASNVMLEPHVL